MTNGESVVVIEEVHLKNPAPMNRPPGRKFLLPPEAHVWVKSSLLDTNNAVATKRVNLRGGPGEAYGVVGTLQKGDAVTTIDTKVNGRKIQAPTNAYAFMAAQYLKQGGEEMAAVSTPTRKPPPRRRPCRTCRP